MSSKSKYPWYKERLKTKYSKDINPVNYYKNWTFLKDGQDDFRDGFPSTDENVIIKPRRGPSPAFLLDDKSSTGKSKCSWSILTKISWFLEKILTEQKRIKVSLNS